MKIKTHSILSEREQQLCWFAVRGLKYRDIGKQLGLTEATVGVYMHQILRKTGYRRRIDLILNHTP
jgi:DNA-binding NarL/FixJ family response regulator